MSKTLKKSLALILSIVMLMGVIPMGMSFAAETEGGYVYEVADGKATIIGYNGTETNIVVPATLGEYPVVLVGEREPEVGVFNGNISIVSIALPDTVTKLIAGSFYGCVSLKEIVVGEGMAVIEGSVFGGCNSLEKICYRGTISQWNAIEITESSRNALEGVEIVYCYGKNCTHNYVVVSNDATCTETGIKTLVCADCGDEIEEPAAAKGHSWDYNAIENYVTSAPTCTAGATAIVPCSACDATTTSWVPALGHTVASWEPLEEATCTETGSKVGRCGACNNLASAVIPAKGHTEDVRPAQEPTCTETGCTESKYCTVCKTWTVLAETVPALGHSYVRDADESSDATCEVAGVDVNVCERCDNIKLSGVSALGHNIVNVDAQAPDCEDGGWNAYEYCTRCNYTTYVAIPANGHTPGAAATCTTAQTCTDCDYVYATELGHTTVELEGYAAGCETTGLTDGSWCPVCEVVLEPQEVLPVLGHNYVTTLSRIEATCTTDGRTAEVACENCGKVAFESEVITAPGHVQKVIPAVDPTCTEAGSTGGIGCENCDEYYFDEPRTIDALGHDLIDLERVEPTCTATGLTAGKKCNRDGCDYVKTKQKVINKLPHTNEVIPGVEPTCTETGLKAGTECTVCGTVTLEREEIPAKGHSPLYVSAVAATCTEVGYNAGYQCSVCDVYTNGHEEVPATGHTPGAAATCTKAQTCETCGAELEAALDHDMVIDTTVSKDATCLKDGYVKAACSRCDYEYKGVVPATDHNVQNWTTIVIPTCKAEGQAIGLCIGCKYDIKKTLPAVEHKDDDKNNKCDYCGGSMGATSDNPSKDEEEEKNDGKCTCLCHAVGIKGLIYDFILMIQRLFGLNRTCKCGEAHY